MTDIGDWFNKPEASTVPKAVKYDATKFNTNERKLNQGNYLSDLAFQRQVDPNVAKAGDQYKDWVVSQMNLGGQIDPEMQSMVVRDALEGAGGAGIVGSDAGRGIVARDLGLTSLGLQQQRMQLGNNLAKDYQMQRLGLAPGSSLALDVANTDMQNQENNNQFQANEAVKGQDSFVGGLAKGFATKAVESAGSTAGTAAGGAAMGAMVGA